MCLFGRQADAACQHFMDFSDYFCFPGSSLSVSFFKVCFAPPLRPNHTRGLFLDIWHPFLDPPFKNVCQGTT